MMAKTKGGRALFLVVSVAFVALAASCSTKKISTAHYYLCIGIANYEYAGTLKYPVEDAKSMAELLSAGGWEVPPSTDTVPACADGLLLDDEATKAGIGQAIQTCFTGAESDSTVFVYFSGHGIYDDSTGSSCMAPYDFNWGTSDGISPTELYGWFAGIPTQNIIFISDSCFSGNFVYCTDSGDTIPPSYTDASGNTIFTVPLYVLSNFGSLLAKNAADDGEPAPVAISAAGAEEYAYDGDESQKHGAFTYYLLQAAESGDSNGDGFVTCTEAYTYVAACIDTYWNSKYSVFYPHISGGMRDLVLFM